MTPEQKWHWEEGNKYALEGMKVLLALNGGAAIALLTFAGHIQTDLAIAQIGRALLALAIGALCAVVVFLFAYLTQLAYGNGNWSSAARWHACTYIPIVISILSFLFGLFFAYNSLPR